MGIPISDISAHGADVRDPPAGAPQRISATRKHCRVRLRVVLSNFAHPCCSVHRRVLCVDIHVSSAARPQSARRRQAARGPQEGSPIIQRPSGPKRSRKNFLGRWIYPAFLGEIYRHRKTFREERRAAPGRSAGDRGSPVTRRARGECSYALRCTAFPIWP